MTSQLSQYSIQQAHSKCSFTSVVIGLTYVYVSIIFFRYVTLCSEHRIWERQNFLKIAQIFLRGLTPKIFVPLSVGVEWEKGGPIVGSFYCWIDWLKSAGEGAQSSEHRLVGVKCYCRVWLFQQSSDPVWSLVILIQSRVRLSPPLYTWSLFWSVSEKCVFELGLQVDVGFLWGVNVDNPLFSLLLAPLSSSLLLPLFFPPSSTSFSFPEFALIKGNDLPGCWRRSLRGCDLWLSCELTQATGSSSLSPLSLECTLFPLFPQWRPFQGHSVERESSCWDHLDGICDWTQLVSVWALRFYWVGLGIYSSCGHPEQASYVSSLAYETSRWPLWSGLPLLALCVWGPFYEPTELSINTRISLNFPTYMSLVAKA